MKRDEAISMIHPDRRQALAFVATLVIGLALVLSINARSVFPDTAPASAAVSFASDAASIGAGVTTRCAFGSINDWYDVYATSRIRELTYEPRKSIAFGPWQARPEYGTPEAAADGALTEWADNYFITHEWSDFGIQILHMIPGDVVTVNGRTVTVEEIFDYPKASFLNEIRHIASEDTMVLQTCVPNDTYNRIIIAR